MSENDIEFTVSLLNLTYKLVGFNAIKEFKEWLDEHASHCTNYGDRDAIEQPAFTASTREVGLPDA